MVTKGAALGVLAVALALMAQTTRAQVVAVVSAKSAVTSLSKTQAADLFLGRADHFDNGAQAVTVDQPEGSVERTEFYQKLTGKSAAQMKAYWAKIIFTGRGHPPKVVQNAGALKELLDHEPNAIGYIERNAVDASVRVLLSP